MFEAAWMTTVWIAQGPRIEKEINKMCPNAILLYISLLGILPSCDQRDFL